jgi:hypothetical protein
MMGHNHNKRQYALGTTQPSMDEIMGELAITFEGSRWRYAGAT